MTSVLTHTVTIRVTDAAGLFSEGIVSINVTKLNNPPKVSPATFTVPENSPVGTVVNTVIASDRDVGQSLSFNITSGNSGDRFAINQATGTITVAKATVDYESTSQFDMSVQVTDNDVLNPLSATALITIRLIDVNEVRTGLHFDAFAVAHVAIVFVY